MFFVEVTKDLSKIITLFIKKTIIVCVYQKFFVILHVKKGR